MENNEKNADKATPDAHCQELSGIGHDGWGEQQWGGVLDEPFAERHIFENRPIREYAKLFEEGSTHEHRLVTIDNPTTPAAKVIQKRN